MAVGGGGEATLRVGGPEPTKGNGGGAKGNGGGAKGGGGGAKDKTKGSGKTKGGP